MQIGSMDPATFATVISACLADFGTPVCCCHADGSRIMDVAKGNIPFFEKNLQEVIRRNVRSGRLVYSADPEDLARKAQVIFLAEDFAEGLEELVMRTSGRGWALPGAVDRSRRFGWVRPRRLKNAEGERAEEPAGVPTDVLHQWMRGSKTSIGRPDHPGNAFKRSRLFAETDFSSAGHARRSGAGHGLRNGGVGARSDEQRFVATKISFINEIASLCEHVNADAVSLSLALGLDKKIAPRCLQPGAGMGGIFAETDMESLTGLARENRVDLKC